MMAKIYGDRWEIIESLGEGGQAHTFLVKDLHGSDETPCVLKRLKNPKRVKRFSDEIESTGRLDHAHIVKLIDHEIQGDEPYLVMEYCPGGSLDESEPFWRDSTADTLGLFQQVCDGVVHAHANGVIHRDLKPANILLRTDRGPAVVADFGLALLEDATERLTETGEAVGPRLFMAPELEDGRLENVQPQADVYSLGKLLYWLFTGRVFSREKHREARWDLKGKTAESPVGWDNIYLEHVNLLLDKMIALDPAERWSAENIRALLRRTTRLVVKERYPMVDGLKHPCSYCGIGYYDLKASSDRMTSVSNFGFTPVGNPRWKIAVCTECGHVQMFRPDLASGSG